MLHINILGEVTLNYGKFLTAVVNFLLMAAIIFLMLRALHTIQEKAAQITGLKEEEVAAEPTTKICPFCQMEIPIKAVRCGHCTSKLEMEEEIDAIEMN